MTDEVKEDDAPTRASKHDRVEGMPVVGKSILINCPRHELFAYWQDFTNLSSFMDNLASVEILEGGRSR